MQAYCRQARVEKSVWVLWAIVCLTLLAALVSCETDGEQVAKKADVPANVPEGLRETNDEQLQVVETEVEDVETEGAGGTNEGGEIGHTEEDGIPGSGNQSESDPTAVAKVYDETVPNFVSNEGAEGKEGNKAPAAGSALKIGRVKVACWDFRTMKHPTNAGQAPEIEPTNLSEDEKGVNLSASGAFPTITNSGEGEESASSGEESGTTEKYSEVEDTEKVAGADAESNDSSNETTDDESSLYESNDVVDKNLFNRTVEIVNMTTLLHETLYSNPALKDRGTPSNCSIVMFYATWCPFSAKAAPHFNALPRAYPPMQVAAIDSSKYKNVNTYFGILSVPSVVLFHNGKIIAKFNDTSFTLNKFAEFIEYFTDLKHEERMNVTTKDFEGPLSSIPTKEIDWYLYMAWVFLIGCFFHYVTKSSIWKRAVDYVRTVWREAQAQHEHMD